MWYNVMTFQIWQGICLLAIQGMHTGKTEQFQPLKLRQIGVFRSVFLFVFCRLWVIFTWVNFQYSFIHGKTLANKKIII